MLLGLIALQFDQSGGHEQAIHLGYFLCYSFFFLVSMGYDSACIATCSVN
jgi:hypothetical protein